MPLLDQRGRLFGKINLIDGVVAAFVIILVPVGYSAYLLFRTPIPTISSLEPAVIMEQQPASVLVTGEDFRPFLGAKLGTTYGTFLLQDPMHAEIKVPPLPAGTYDLVLFDEALELTRKAGALTVMPLPPAAILPPAIDIELQLVGEFVDVSEVDATTIRVGLALGDGAAFPARVVATASPTPEAYRIRVAPQTTLTMPKPGAVRLPAILRVTCELANDQCNLAGTAVVQGAVLTLPLVSGRRPFSFLIRDVRKPDAPDRF